MHALVLLVLAAAPAFDRSPAKVHAMFDLASWVDPVRAHGWDPLRPGLWRLIQYQVVLSDGRMTWGDARDDQMASGVSGRITSATKQASGWELEVVSDGGETFHFTWRWLAADRAVWTDGSIARELVQLRDGESCVDHQGKAEVRLRAAWLERLAGAYGRGTLRVEADGTVTSAAGVRRSWLSPCLTRCEPDAGAGVCVTTESGALDPQERAPEVWLFEPRPDGGVVAHAADASRYERCPYGPLAEPIGPVLDRQPSAGSARGAAPR